MPSCHIIAHDPTSPLLPYLVPVPLRPPFDRDTGVGSMCTHVLHTIQQPTCEVGPHEWLDAFCCTFAVHFSIVSDYPKSR